MHHPGLVSLVLLGLSLCPDLGQALPKSQATFARDMRGDVMYNVADAGEQVILLSLLSGDISTFTFPPTDFSELRNNCFDFANFPI